jgi:hypothetical protein
LVAKYASTSNLLQLDKDGSSSSMSSNVSIFKSELSIYHILRAANYRNLPTLAGFRFDNVIFDYSISSRSSNAKESSPQKALKKS